MKKIIGVVLIVLAMALGYMGYERVTNSGKSVKLAGVELSATNQDKQTEGYLFLGGAFVAFVGGIVLVGKK